MHLSRRVTITAFWTIAALSLGLAVLFASGWSSGTWLLDDAEAHYVLLSAAAAAACVSAAHRSSGAARVVWALLAASAFCNVLGDIGWIALGLLGIDPNVSAVDVVYLASYPLLLLALWRIARARDPRGGTDAIVDGLAVAAGLGLLAWQAIIVAPDALRGADGTLGLIVVVGYPLLDVFVVGALVALLLCSGARNASLVYLFAYVVLFLVADVIFAVASASDPLHPWTDPLYLAAYVALGAAALHRCAPHVADHQAVEPAGPGRFLLLGASVVSPSVTAAIAVSIGGGIDPIPLLVVSMALAAVVTFRVASTMSAERIARRRAEGVQLALERLALEDQLTGLPNRHALIEQLSTLPASAGVALLFIDLDRFKVINDTAGHQVGDEVLRQVAVRIAESLRDDDTVFRLAGDEFVALCADRAAPGEAEQVAQRIIDCVAPPFVVDGLEWYLGASVGVSTSDPGEPIEPDQLLRDADVAMYDAKREGRRTVRRYDRRMHERIDARHRLEGALRRAVAQDEIEPAFQAIVELGSQRIVGFETLARWPDGSGGHHPAQDFIELAEQTGLITAIDHQMLRRACRFVAAFNDRHLDAAPIWVSVNISTTELAAGDLAGRVGSVLLETGIDPSWLVLELTEGALTVDPDVAVRRLEEVHALGVRLAVDDFGTGFSSLEHLLRFPVEVLKIDRVFVAELARSTAGRSVAAAARQLAHTLGLQVIAEGVETAEQAEILVECGYELAQGYLFARPISASDAMRLGDLPALAGGGPT